MDINNINASDNIINDVMILKWTELSAIEIAKKEGIVLNNEYWTIIYFIREFYLQYNIYPSIRMLISIMKKKYGSHKGNSIYLFKMFPKGPIQQASKIAGLPKLTSCL